MKSFKFDLQRFDALTINAGETQTLDGVTYTALDGDAVLKYDDDFKVSGLTSGKVSAVVAGASDSSTLTIDATDGSTDFTLTGNGEVLTLTKVLPFELDNGTFTLASNVLTAAKGSDLKIGNGKTYGDGSTVFGHDYADTEVKYTITDTALTEETEKETITFTASLGEQSRSITTFVNGTIINGVDDGKFTGGFTISKDSSMGLVLGDYTLKATANADATSQILVNSDGANITPGSGDGTLNVSLTRGDTTIFGGALECTSGKITLGYDHAVTFTEGTSFNFTWNNYVSTITATGDATTAIALTDSGITFTPGSGDGGLNLLLTKDGTPIFAGELNISDGSITFNSDEQKFSFTEGTKISLGIGTDGSRAMDFEVTGGDASFKMAADENGNFTITPDENDGSLSIALKQNGETVFQNTVTVNGAMTINPVTDLLTLKDGTTVSLAFDNYTMTATADGDAASKISLTASGISITPQQGDGTLNLTLGSANGSMSVDVEILSGGFLFGTSGALSVTEGTELQIKFSDDYIVNFKATDAAGGALSIGADGLTFAPGTEDGGLELSVTRNGETRTASLDVTGSLTYKLDGSISLSEGTVVKNVFEDGNILTITANTDASGSIVFSPAGGLYITPSTADALTVVLTAGDLKVAEFSSITGTINYSGGVVTASDGAKIYMTDYEGYSSLLTVEGGTVSVTYYGADKAVYTVNEGATCVVAWDDGATWEIQNGSVTDSYNGVAILSAGAIFNSNDPIISFTLDKAGNYTLNGINVTTSQDNVQVQLANYDTISFAAGSGIKVSATEDNAFGFKVGDDGTISVTSTDSGNFGVNSGSITFDDGQAVIAKDTVISLAQGERVITFTVNEDISAPSKIEEGIYYITLDDESINLSIAQSGQMVLTGDLEIDGVFSFNPSTGTFGLTGANSSHGDGNNTSFQFSTQLSNGSTYTFKAETSDTTVVFVPTYADGKFEMNFPNENKNAMKFTVSKDEQTVFENQITIDGSVGFDTANQQLSLTKDTVLTLVGGDGNALEITALDDAGGQLNMVNGGIRFAPNENDGALELNFIAANRKADLSITGAVIFSIDGKITLEDGTEATFTWEDGNSLKLTSSGSTGSIGFSDKGLKITSDDENLNMTFTTSSASTDISGIKGTIYYNAGVVSFDENSTITATTTLGGQPILTTLETIDGTGHISFNTTNGVIYAADTGAMRITWTKDDLESTFTVNSGSIQIGHNLFRITEGSDIVTDLKTFVPALYFTTDEAGTYTINGQTITTSAEGLALTATDDQMVFTTSDDNAVEYEGMNFAGAGKVSLSPDNVVLGAGVEATGFGEENSFVLAEAGNVTADAKIFELSKIEGTPREIPMIITVTGAQDGFVFSRTLTKESEAYLDDALDDEKFENYTSSYIGQVFTEKFISAGDSSYRIRTDAIGLEEVIGISDGATVTGGASLADEPTLSYYNLVTDTEGTFTIGEKAYNVSGDSSVAIRARFEVDTAPYASYVDSLNGTISGDFSGGAFKINGSSSLQVTGDSSIEIVADASGFEILGLDAGASLKVEAADTYVVNGTTINANAGDYIVGLGESSAFLTGTNNNTLITGTDSDDYIANSGASVTINAGTGDDSITNTGDNVLFQYSGGNDSISGFNATSTLSISGSEYSTATSGDDLIVTVGESKITLINAASLSSANIETPDPIVQLVEAALKRTAAGYPAIAAVAFHPNEDLGDEPTNYSDKEDWSITSTDNLKLHAVHYTPENSNDKWVVLIHGYGHSHDAMYQYATAYLANGYNVLMIDQRAAGESEGTWLTMGAAESEDVALWTQEIARRNSNAKITLHGISMGSATAMLAAARSDATNVTSLVEDCGYTNVLDVFSIINDAYLKQPSEVVTAMDPVAASLTGYYLHDAAPIDSISSATMPSIFITGDADSVVPMSMFTELYDASGAEVKEQFIVKDATHGRAGLTDSIGYSNAVFRFVAEADGEGWVTENTTDEITLRGTKYDDTITNSGYFVAIAGLSGNDSIVNEGEYTSINGGAGNDTISNSGASSIIEGDAGADVITNSSSTAMIRGGGGADTISNTGDNVTVDGGAGNDSIYNDASNVTFTYAAGAGDDTISGFNETSTLRIATDEYSSAKSGDDLIVTVGENSITLKDAAGLSVANIVNGGLNMINTENNTLITGTAFDDFISNSGTKVTIDTADGDDLVINNVDSSLVAASLGNSIEAGNGNDTIYSHHTYNPTIAGGAGDDSIVVSRGHLTYIDGGAGNDSIIGELTNRTAGNWRMGGYATILGGAGDDYIDPGYSDHSTINGGEGNDTILNNGISSTLDGGTGNNLIRITNIAEGAGGQFVVLNGNTTVEGFNTGFGEGTDTMYIDGDPAGVYFNDDVLTFSNSTDSLTFSDVTTTAKVNIYHKSREVLNKGVFIAEDDWYSVTADDLTVNAGEEVYFVGPSATEKHGVDFSGITSDLNVTIDTAYIDSEDYVPGTTTWINGVYSLRGGAGNTTITGSNKADTIIAGTGATTINAGAGENFVNLEDAESALIQLAGNTTLKGFKTGFGEGTDTIYIDGDPAGVYFNDGVLAFSNSTDSLTLSDVTTTAKVNIYHKRREMLNKGVFIAAGDWYKVEDSDLTVDAGEEVYFVGTAADPKAGVDFSDISSALNITMNTAYIDSEDYVPGTTTWINGVYSLKGGAGLTTVTGSDQSDTILAGTGKTTINAGAGDDVISLQSSAALVQYNAGDGNDSISNFNSNSTLKIAGETYTSTKSGDDLIFSVGDDKITLAGAANLSAVNVDGTSETDAIIESIGTDNYSVVSAGETSAQKISLDGGELVVVEDTSAKVSITASKGSDTIYSAGDNVTVNLTGGATNLIAAGGKMTVENYNATTGAAFVTNYDNILTEVDGGAIYFEKGKMSVDSAIVDFNGINSGIVNFYDASGELQKVAPVSPDESLDLSKETDNFILVADKYSTLTGGKGNDSLFAFAGSRVNESAGKNYIEIDKRNSYDDGVKISLGGGKTTIKNFNTGFDDTSDRFFGGVNDSIDLKFDGVDLKYYINGELCGIATDISSDEPFVNITAEDANGPVKIAVAQENAVITVDDELADLYIGEKSGVDFTNYEGNLSINLGLRGNQTIGAGEVLFSGINQVSLGSGVSSLIGSASRETLAAGTGAATINGGAGNDLLVGNTSDDKDGSTEFVFETGGGRDTVSNFEFLTDSNLMTADRISVDSAVTNVVLKNSGDVIIQRGEDWLTLENAQGKQFKINDLVATVDKNDFEFDGTTNYFLATGKRATLTVGEDVVDEAIIWLGNQQSNQFVGDFRTIDASNLTAKAELAGNDLDNVICAGAGDASLWGGNGGDDLLIGGKAHNLFFYASGNGNDTIQSANDGDAVIFSEISIDQILATNITADGTTINFKDGGTLNVATSNAVEFAFNDATYLADHSTGTWQQK